MNTRRKLEDRALIGLAVVALVVAMIPLADILYFVVVRGASSINLNFLTSLPTPPNIPGGGIGNALQGTIIMIVLASAIGLPIGVLSGVYVSEFGGPRPAGAVRFIADVLAGIPSIVIGVFVYLLIVVPTHTFSALAGGVALGMIMVPLVCSTTSEALKLVPNSIREASLALGIRKWHTTLTAISNARSGIITGVFLSIARTTGETAPLFLTTLGTNFWFSGLTHPTASITLLVYNYATSGIGVWVEQAWGASLILMFVVLGIDIIVRAAMRSRIHYSN